MTADRRGLTVTHGGAADIPSDPEALAEDIERTRQQVGESVAALSAKLDMKARLRDTAGRFSDWIVNETRPVACKISESTVNIGRAANERRAPLALVAGGMLATGAWLTWMIKRR